MSELQFWEIGEQLGYAAIKFGDPYQTEKWKSAGDVGAIDAHELLLVADLFGRIQEGDLVAFGFRIAPTVSDGPVRIPGHTFEPRPDLALTRCGELRVSGYSYERIRILPRSEVEKAKSANPISTNLAGRRSTYAKSKIVIEMLFQTESNRSKSATKLHPDFEMEFKRRFPSSEWKIAPPSERTLRNHLIRYWQELEEMHSA